MRPSAGLHIYRAADAEGGACEERADPRVVFNFYINPEKPARKHGWRSVGLATHAWFVTPITQQRSPCG